MTGSEVSQQYDEMLEDCTESRTQHDEIETPANAVSPGYHTLLEEFS